MTESAPKQDNERGPISSRRRFLKDAGRFAAAVAAGAVGGTVATEDFFKNTEEGIIPPNPTQEWIDSRLQTYTEAIASGDAESAEVAIELIGVYETEIQNNLILCARLHGRMVRSRPNQGLRAITELELSLLAERRQWLIQHINQLKDPMHNFLEDKERDTKENRNPDSGTQSSTNPSQPKPRELPA